MKFKQLIAGFTLYAMLFTLMPLSIQAQSNDSGSIKNHLKKDITSVMPRLTSQELQEIAESSSARVILNNAACSFFKQFIGHPLLDTISSLKVCCDHVQKGLRVVDYENFIDALEVLSALTSSGERFSSHDSGLADVKMSIKNIFSLLYKGVLFLEQKVVAAQPALSHFASQLEEKVVYVCPEEQEGKTLQYVGQNLDNVLIGNVEVTGNLQVNNKTFFLGAVTFAAPVIFNTLTVPRKVVTNLVGPLNPISLVEDDNYTTSFSGGVYMSRDVGVNGDMSIMGTSTFFSSVTVSGTNVLFAGQIDPTNLSDTITFNGNIEIPQGKTVVIGSDLYVNGRFIVPGELVVSQSDSVFVPTTAALYTNLIGSSDLNGTTSFKNSVLFTSPLTINGTSTFNDSLSVSGTNQLFVNEISPTELNATTTFVGNVYIGTSGASRTLTTSGDAVIHGNVSVDGQVSTNNLAVSGALGINTLNVTGNQTVGGTLGVTGATTLANMLTVAGLSLLNGGSTVNGDLKVQGAGAVIVEEAATFNASVSITGTNQLLVNEINQVVGGGTLQLGRSGINAGLVAVNTSGMTVSGPMTHTSTSSFNGDVTVGVLGTSSATLTTTGDAIVHGNMSVDGQISSSSLAVTGAFGINTLNVTGNQTVGGTLGVTGATTLANTLTVAGLSLLNGGSTINGDVKVQGAGTMTVDEPATFNASVSVTGTNQLLVNEVQQVNAGGTLNVGRTGVNAGLININTSGATVSGPLTLLSTSSFNGNVTVGVLGTSSATLTTTGDVVAHGNILADGQLSSSNLAVSGSGIINVLSVTGDETVGGTLGVTGAATLGNSLGVTGATTLANTLTVAGLSLLNGGSTVNGDVKVQGAGTMTVEEPATFNASVSVTGTNHLLVNEVQQVNAGGTLNVGRTGVNAGLININTSGATVSGPLTLLSTSSFNGNVTVGVLGTSSATLTTTGDVIAHGNMSVDGQVTSGNLTVSGSGIVAALNVTGNETVGGTLGVTGAATLGNSLGVTGATTLANTLTVAGLSLLNGGSTINGDVKVQGAGTMTVEEPAIFNASVSVTGTNQLLVNEVQQVNAGGTLNVGRTGASAGLIAINTTGMTVSGPMTHTNTSSFNGNVTVGVLGTSSATLTTTGDVIAHGNISVDGQISSSNLAVSGSGIMSALNVTGNETVGGTLGVAGATTLGNSLGVTGATTLANTLTVAGLSLLNGGSTINGDVKVQGSGTVTVEEPTTFNASMSVTGTNQLLVNEVQQVNAGGTLNVGRTGVNAGLININTSGATVSGPLTLLSTSSFNGNVTVGVLGISSATLTTTGDVIAHGNMNVDGQISAQNVAVSGALGTASLNVTGNETVGGTLGVAGATTLGNSLGVTGATTLANTLTVAGLSLLNGGSTVNGDLKVQGAGNVIVEEPATFNASVSVTGTNTLLVNEISPGLGSAYTTTFAGNIFIANNSTLTLHEIGALSITDTVTFAGSIHIIKGMTVVESSTFQNDLSVYNHIYNPSDRRIKTNIKVIDPQESLDKILQLSPHTYKYTQEWCGKSLEKQEEERGFIAQEVKEVIPHLVSVSDIKTSDGKVLQNFHQLDYIKLVVDLVGALKATQQQIIELKNRVSFLESSVSV